MGSASHQKEMLVTKGAGGRKRRLDSDEGAARIPKTVCAFGAILARSTDWQDFEAAPVNLKPAGGSR